MSFRILDVGYIFLASDQRIGLEGIDYIAGLVMTMNYFDEEKRRIRTDIFEGTIERGRENVRLGNFSGPVYGAKLDLISGGKANLCILVDSERDRCRKN